MHIQNWLCFGACLSPVLHDDVCQSIEELSLFLFCRLAMDKLTRGSPNRPAKIIPQNDSCFPGLKSQCNYPTVKKLCTILNCNTRGIFNSKYLKVWSDNN